MPLASPSQLTDLSVLEKTRSQANHLASLALLTNQQATEILQKDNAELTAWLQGKASELGTLFQRHLDVGTGINAIITAVQATLNEAGDTTNIPTVDTRPFEEKLAAQGRTLNTQTLVVSNIATPS